MTSTRATVVKLGSSLIANDDGEPRHELVAQVASDLTAHLERGLPVAVVSSGAIALGRRKTGHASRHVSRLAHLQAASALGQAELQQLWQRAFDPHGLHVAQVLQMAIHQGPRGPAGNFPENAAAARIGAERQAQPALKPREFAILAGLLAALVFLIRIILKKENDK